MYSKHFKLNVMEESLFKLMNHGDNSVAKWILKSTHELNRYSNYLILLNTLVKSNSDNYFIQAIHESLVNCSVSIVFSIFNIFTILTKTEYSFYDHHIADYFAGKKNLAPDDYYLLTFFWHQPVEFLNSLPYAADVEFVLQNSGGDSGFRVVDSTTKKSILTDNHSDTEGFIPSVQFFCINLLNIVGTLNVIADNLPDETKTDGISPDKSILHIENYEQLKNIIETSIYSH